MSVEWLWRSRHGRLRARIVTETAADVTFEFAHETEPCPRGLLTLPKEQFMAIYVGASLDGWRPSTPTPAQIERIEGEG